MSKKYFNYSFQVKRTKEGAIALVVVVLLALIIFITWYNKRTVTTYIGDLTYEKVPGFNEFKSGECTKAYKINYKKDTCGTVCINKTSLDKTYLKSKKEEMEKGGFTFSKTITKKIGNKTWDYLKTTKTEPVISYYSINVKDSTYTLEYIDQTSSIDNKSKCNDILNSFMSSINVK